MSVDIICLLGLVVMLNYSLSWLHLDSSIDSALTIKIQKYFIGVMKCCVLRWPSDAGMGSSSPATLHRIRSGKWMNEWYFMHRSKKWCIMYPYGIINITRLLEPSVEVCCRQGWVCSCTSCSPNAPTHLHRILKSPAVFRSPSAALHCKPSRQRVRGSLGKHSYFTTEAKTDQSSLSGRLRWHFRPRLLYWWAALSLIGFPLTVLSSDAEHVKAYW